MKDLEADCFYKKKTTDIAHTSLSYRSSIVRDLIHGLKYDKNFYASSICAQLVAENILELSKKENISGAIIIPIPRLKSRIQKYGFNQCEILCVEILKNLEIKKLNFKYFPKILIQHKNFETQTKLSRKNRIANAEQSFSVKSPGAIAGQKIILIDDVWTTGATLLDAERALKNAGICSVFKFTIAH
ncbi:MAG: phosphoribosyltransferase family protein [Candidatus Paceibacterota bacterium]